MNFSLNVAILATAVTLSNLVAQTRTNTTVCGTSSSVAVINVGRLTATVQTAPGVSEQLWSEGTFLAYTGHFYEVQMENYSFGPARLGIGLLSLRVGPNTVRQTWCSTVSANPSDSLRQDVFGANTSKTFNVSGVGVVVSGNVNVNMSASCALAWPANGIVIDGNLSGDATGRASAALASPVSGITASAPNNLRFGRQQLRGRGEVWSAGNFSALRYDLDPMTVSLSASVNVIFFTITAVLVNASHAAVSIANFR